MKKFKSISTKVLTKDLIDKFSILNGAKYFSLIKFQNYLVFILTKNYIKYFSSTSWLESWKSNGMSKDIIKNITKSDSNFASNFVDHQLLPDKNFNEHCLIKNSISISKKVINVYISYTLIPKLKHLNTEFTLSKCLFESVKLT